MEEAQKTKGDDIGRIIMEAKEGRTGKAEEKIKEYIEAGNLFKAQSLAQAIGRELTVDEWKRAEEVCRQNGDKDKAEVALQKAKKLQSQ